MDFRGRNVQSSDSQSKLKAEDDEPALEGEMDRFLDSLRDFQMRMSDDLSQKISTSPPGYNQHLEYSHLIGPPEKYRDEEIEKGLLRISESTEELRRTLSAELLEIKDIIPVCPKSVSFAVQSTYDDYFCILEDDVRRRHSNESVQAMIKLKEDPCLLEEILKRYPSEAFQMSSLMKKIGELERHKTLLNKLSQDLEVLKQHIAERDEIIALYTSNSSAPPHLLRKPSR